MCIYIYISLSIYIYTYVMIYVYSFSQTPVTPRAAARHGQSVGMPCIYDMICI